LNDRIINIIKSNIILPIYNAEISVLKRNIRLVEEDIDKVFSKYEYYRKQIKKFLGMDEIIDLMDRHKIASIVMASIMEVKPLKSDILRNNNVAETNRLPIEKYCNEYLAFKSAISIVESFIKCNSQIENYKKQIILDNGILLPHCTHEDYLIQVIKGLSLSFSLNNKIDILSWSNLLFVLEQYTYQTA
jgi:hypothetical protein